MLNGSAMEQLGRAAVIAPERVSRVASTVLPTAYGRFRMLGYTDGHGIEHVALVLGDVAGGPAPLVRLHSECLTGDALGSWRCECGEQLRAAMAAIGIAGRGILIYLRGHEGRGIGLVAKLRAYALQDAGLDTVDANLELGLEPDGRDYAAAAAILGDLGVDRVRLLSGNPEKAARLGGHGIAVESRVSPPVVERAENAFYLDTKRRRMGHDLALTKGEAWDALISGIAPDGAMTQQAVELVDRYRPLVEIEPLVVAQLALSLDGFIASRIGDADSVSGAEDHEHLHRLRALVHAVVVGGSTVIADDPRLTVRSVPGPSPVRVVLDPSGRVPLESRVLHDGIGRTIWMRGVDVPRPEVVKPHVEVVTLPLPSPAGPGAGAPVGGGFEPARVLAALAERGLTKVLVEGGGRLVSSFVASGQVDRLYLTTAPLLIGDGIPGIRFTGADRLADAVRAPTRRFLLGADVCTEFDLASVRAGA